MKQSWRKYDIVFLLLAVIIIFTFSNLSTQNKQPAQENESHNKQPDYWEPPVFNFDTVTSDEQLKTIIYGHELIKNTSKYFGPAGSINKYGNGMNCQNCHLGAGSKPWGNNYGAVASTYPKFRPRSGKIDGIPKRVNDCIERSLNGKTIDTAGYEMQAIVAFMNWLGQNVKKSVQPKGTGIVDLKYMNRAASPAKGQVVYIQKCQRCHGENGLGKQNLNGIGYIYPPLWGEHSYNSAAGLYRLTRFAGFVKDNMPFDQATHQNPILTDTEAWDVSAFVNSQPRPKGDTKSDWPNIATKPIDNPFGPYSDSFKEEQHKYGPYEPIAAIRKGKAGTHQ